MQQAGPNAEALVVDVRDESALAARLADVAHRRGRVDAVVAAAGVISGGRALWEVDEAEWRTVMDTDLAGVWHTIKAAVPHMLASPGPRRFVAVASAAGTLGLPRLGVYAAAKHGVIGLVPLPGRGSVRHRRHRQCRGPRLHPERPAGCLG